MKRLSTVCTAALAAVAITLIASPAASAGTITGQGNTVGHKYRGGVASLGGIGYAAGVQVTHDATGSVEIRAAGRISKISKVSRVQVDSVALGTATIGLTKNSVPLSSGTANSVTSYSNWKVVAAGTCASYRVRVNYSVRWTDQALSKFSILSPLTTVCGKKTTKSCPDPKDIQSLDSNLRTITKCFDSNNWIFAGGLYPSGNPVDGIDVIHQTSPGKYVLVTQGSSFVGDEDGLKRLGIPASVANLLTNGGWSFSGGIISYPRSAYTAVWERHTSVLRIGSTNGSVLYGSGCCNSIGVPLNYSMDAGVLMGTVSGPATYTGTSFNDVRLPVGTAFFFHFEPGATGLVLVSTNRISSTGGPIIWCGQHYDGRCGA